MLFHCIKTIRIFFFKATEFRDILTLLCSWSDLVLKTKYLIFWGGAKGRHSCYAKPKDLQMVSTISNFYVMKYSTLWVKSIDLIFLLKYNSVLCLVLVRNLYHMEICVSVSLRASCSVLISFMSNNISEYFDSKSRNIFKIVKTTRLINQLVMDGWQPQEAHTNVGLLLNGVCDMLI